MNWLIHSKQRLSKYMYNSFKTYISDISFCVLIDKKHIHFFVFLCFYIQYFQMCFGLNLLVCIRVFKVYQVSSVSVIFLTKASPRTLYNVDREGKYVVLNWTNGLR